eukprot:gene3188-3659_t
MSLNRDSSRTELKTKTTQPIQEAFSYTWYPTQCQIGGLSSREISRQPREEENNTRGGGPSTYQVFKSEEDGEEMIVVEQATPPGQQQHCTTTNRSGSPLTPLLKVNSPERLVRMGSKFSEQQSRTLMITWKALHNKDFHAPTCQDDWREITNRVNMAPGSYKTIKQVKKKFKNLRDRYRALKVKNKRKGITCNKIRTFYAEFEQVFGDEDLEATRRSTTATVDRQNKPASKSTATGTGVNTSNHHESSSPPSLPSTQALSSAVCDQVATISQKTFTTTVGTVHVDFGDKNPSKQQPMPTLDSVMSFAVPSESDSSYNRQVESNISRGDGRFIGGTGSGGHLPAPAPAPSSSNTSDDSRNYSQLKLVEAVRELQQQQITMQREISRNMKLMEERILNEVSTKIKESEDRSRQQIANALTQLGNLIRIA